MDLSSLGRGLSALAQNYQAGQAASRQQGDYEQKRQDRQQSEGGFAALLQAATAQQPQSTLTSPPPQMGGGMPMPQQAPQGMPPSQPMPPMQTQGPPPGPGAVQQHQQQPAQAPMPQPGPGAVQPMQQPQQPQQMPAPQGPPPRDPNLSGVAAPTGQGFHADSTATLMSMAKALKQANPNAPPAILMNALQQQIGMMKGVEPETRAYIQAEVQAQRIQMMEQQSLERAQSASDVAQIRADSAAQVAQVRAEAARDVADAGARSRENVAGTNAGARVQSAGISADARLKAPGAAIAAKQPGIDAAVVNKDRQINDKYDKQAQLLKYHEEMKANDDARKLGKPLPYANPTLGGATTKGGAKTPDASHIAWLKAHPQAKASFDRMYGAGAAARAGVK